MGVEFDEVTGTVDKPGGEDSSRGNQRSSTGAKSNKSPDAARREIQAAVNEAQRRAVRLQAT